MRNLVVHVRRFLSKQTRAALEFATARALNNIDRLIGLLPKSWLKLIFGAAYWYAPSQVLVRIRHRRFPNACADAVFWLRLAAAHVFMSMNAYASAFDILLPLRDIARNDDAFSPNDLLRIEFALAYAASRSGRAQFAEEILSQAVLRDQASSEAQFIFGKHLLARDRQRGLWHLQEAYRLNPQMPPSQMTILAEALLSSGIDDRILDVIRHGGEHRELVLTRANLMFDQGDGAEHCALVGKYFEAWGLRSPDQRKRAIQSHSRVNAPIATVIMTAFNAAATIESAMQSISEQTEGRFEVIVVDDSSVDDTCSLIEAHIRNDSRFTLIRNSKNSGTYVGRNTALRRATGTFVTFHDSDDWMHPERLGRHLEVMRGRTVMSLSNWIRVDGAGRILVRPDGLYLHLNPSSTFFPRSLVEKIGYFDSVRTGADSEFLFRVKAVYGSSAVEFIEAPLGIGLHRANSLTTSALTGFDADRFSQSRLDYAESWSAWHTDQLASGANPYLPALQTHRVFEIPEALAP